MPQLPNKTSNFSKLPAIDGKQTDYSDTGPNRVPALFLRVTPKGKREWHVTARLPGRSSSGRYRLDSLANMTLTEARLAANEFKVRARDGFDPIAERKGRQSEAEEKRELAKDRSVAVIARKYIELHAKPHKVTWRQDELTLENTVLPKWGNRQIDAIKKNDVVDLLDAVGFRAREAVIERKIKSGLSRSEAESELAKADGVPGDYAKGRILDVIRRMFNWCLDERGIIEASPVGRKMWKNPARTRKRAFNNDEIRSLWDATAHLHMWKKSMIRVLLLTGQRTGVVRGMRHSEIDTENRTWTIQVEAGRSKNKVAHVVPLTDEVIKIYKAVPRVEGIDHVFWAGGGFQRRGIDKAPELGTKLKDELRAVSSLSDFTWQHLRGLATTKMRELRVPKEIVNLVQGRFDGSVQAKNYDSHDYFDEKREALQAYENAIMAIVRGDEQKNVVMLRDSV